MRFLLTPLSEKLAARSIHDPQTGCTIYTGRLNHRGYGIIGFGGKTLRVHRAAWELEKGPIPEGLTLDHYRLNPGPRNAPCSKACFATAHLECVPLAVNIKRAGVQSLKPFCPQGHPYDEQNTMRRRDGSRVCITCNRRRVARQYDKIRKGSFARAEEKA